MKTATADQLPQQWPQILRWVAAGEEVQVTDQDKVVARLLPPVRISSPAPRQFGANPRREFRSVKSYLRQGEAVCDLPGHRLPGQTLLPGAE